MGGGGDVQYSSFRRGDREGQEGREEGQEGQEGQEEALQGRRADEEPADWRRGSCWPDQPPPAHLEGHGGETRQAPVLSSPDVHLSKSSVAPSAGRDEKLHF